MNKNGLESNGNREFIGDKATEHAFKEMVLRLETHYNNTKGLNSRRDAKMQQLLHIMQQLVMQIDSGVKPHWIPESLKNLSIRAKRYLPK